MADMTRLAGAESLTITDVYVRDVARNAKGEPMLSYYHVTATGDGVTFTVIVPSGRGVPVPGGELLLTWTCPVLET